MKKILNRSKKPEPLPIGINVDALYSHLASKEKDLKEKRKQARYSSPKETDIQADIFLARFFVNHKLLSEIGERTVLHNLNSGMYGKPGSAKYDYVSAWLKDVEYERTLDYADETNDLARAANKAAEDSAAEAKEANTIARRAFFVATISALIAIISVIIAIATLLTTK